MNFKDNIPIYLQIKDFIYQEIVTHKLELGDKLPSVRDLALELSVNTNTVQRALGELIDEQIIETKRGKGNFVMETPTMVNDLRQKLVTRQLDEFYDNLKSLDLNNQEIVHYVENYLEEKENEHN